MTVSWITEMNFSGYIPSTHTNMRTEFAWMNASGGYHQFFFGKIKPADVMILILPKRKTSVLSILIQDDILPRIRSNCKYIGIMQEGPNNYWEDYDLDLQLRWYNFVNSCDFILCHNEIDKLYYSGMFSNPKVFVNKTLLIPESLDIKEVDRSERSVYLGGNLCSWYGGFKSYVIASHLNPSKITFPSMGRMVEDEESLDNEIVTHEEYLELKDWASRLNTHRWAIHMMPTVAAGSFSLYCAYLGIPCIGNELVDTQVTCFPYTSVNVNDVKAAKNIALDLDIEDYYHYISDLAICQYKENYTVEKWKKSFNEILEEIQK